MRFDLVSLGDHLPDPHTREYGQTQAERLRSIVDTSARAEDLGYGGVWLGEHHSSDYLMPSPQMVLAAIAERTERLRLGTAVSLLQTNDPVRIAEDFATLDVLSGGRAEIGFGSGISRIVYEMFDQDPSAMVETGAEHLELLRRLWNERDVTWKGERRTPFEGVRCTPSTTTGREIPIHLGATRSPANAVLAGELGLKVMLGTVIGSYRDFRPLADAYRASYRAAGHDPAGMGVSIICMLHVGEDGSRAREQWAPYLTNYLAFRIGGLLSADSLMALPPMDGPPPPAEAEMAGSPTEIVDRIGQAIEDVGGADVVQCGMDVGGLPVDALLTSMELFADRVIPELSSG
jgi:alkanesulfonate monooxygenase SsuD/methylene tetrahydromethanopterin reductase-like flavin-dependent oxidoreductase (luciferase family)